MLIGFDVVSPRDWKPICKNTELFPYSDFFLLVSLFHEDNDSSFPHFDRGIKTCLEEVGGQIMINIY